MNTERIVSEWLRSVAPPRAPEGLLDRALAGVATSRQETVRPVRLQALASRRPTTRILMVAAVLGGGAILGSLFVGGGQPHPAQPTVRPLAALGAVAYATNGSIFLVGTEREAPDATEIAANGTGGLGYGTPTWSTNGRYLLFTGAPPTQGASRIFVTDPEGGRMASFPGWLASWSPDSSQIVAWDDPFRTVGIWSVDGRRLATVAFPDGVALPGDSAPTFTGDGRALYFPLDRTSLEPRAVPIDGSAPYELSPILTAGDPVFSNDGTRLALPAVDGLYVAGADGSGSRLVAHPAVGRFYDAVWSRSDDRIAVAWDGAGAGESLVIVDVASGQTVIAWPASPGERVHPIRWAPDGRSVLMTSRTGIYRVMIPDSSTTKTFGRSAFYEDPAHDPSSDLGADWRWIAAGP